MSLLRSRCKTAKRREPTISRWQHLADFALGRASMTEKAKVRLKHEWSIPRAVQDNPISCKSERSIKKFPPRPAIRRVSGRSEISKSASKSRKPTEAKRRGKEEKRGKEGQGRGEQTRIWGRKIEEKKSEPAIALVEDRPPGLPSSASDPPPSASLQGSEPLILCGSRLLKLKT